MDLLLRMLLVSQSASGRLRTKGRLSLGHQGEKQPWSYHRPGDPLTAPIPPGTETSPRVFPFNHAPSNPVPSNPTLRFCYSTGQQEFPAAAQSHTWLQPPRQLFEHFKRFSRLAGHSLHWRSRCPQLWRWKEGQSFGSSSWSCQGHLQPGVNISRHLQSPTGLVDLVILLSLTGPWIWVWNHVGTPCCWWNLRDAAEGNPDLECYDWIIPSGRTSRRPCLVKTFPLSGLIHELRNKRRDIEHQQKNFPGRFYGEKCLWKFSVMQVMLVPKSRQVDFLVSL
ncbi:uncharacterized protein LOC120318086 [Crotalus tigris]|uniref:uncharacterized protein LOC120318086 n=1 Tax=Crotalus tigris TaxID=88082 RepID=UPI00192F455E|nr:uncharacterized protein LOC120318086 [Crotalus tigris]XP_039221278.1 uncharacterized protein LOC120318086 [Crotalus tigris]